MAYFALAIKRKVSIKYFYMELLAYRSSFLLNFGDYIFITNNTYMCYVRLSCMIAYNHCGFLSRPV